MALIINKQLFDKKRNLYIAAFIRHVGSANEIEQRRGGTMDGLLSDSAAAQERWEVGGGKGGAEFLQKQVLRDRVCFKKVARKELRSCNRSFIKGKYATAATLTANYWSQRESSLATWISSLAAFFFFC